MHNDRQEIAREAARLMAEEGYADWAAAKHKAVARLGMRRPAMPSNAEVASALREHLQLFAADETRDRLRERRRLAVQIMCHLQSFRPRAAGALINGLMTERSPLEIHLFADPPEQVDIFLTDHNWDYDDAELHLRHPDGRDIAVPMCLLNTDDGVVVELIVFDGGGARWSPTSPVDGKPMARLDRAALEALIADSASDAAA